MQEKLTTKDRIISAARPLFARQGFKGTTTAEIAGAAEISEGTIYRHFSSKEELLIECVKPVFQYLLETAEVEIFEKSQNFRDLIYKGFEIRLNFFEKHYDTFRILFNELPYSNEIINQYMNFLKSQEDHLSEMIYKVKELGEIKRTRNFLIFALGQFMSLWLYINFRNWSKTSELNLFEEMLSFSEEHILDDLTDFFMYGISGIPDKKHGGE